MFPDNWDINGHHVLIKPDTPIELRSAKGSSTITITHDHVKPYLGEAAKAYGKYDRKTHTVTATRIELADLETHEIDGSGIIDAILPPLPNADPADRLVRADGYPVLLSTKTTVVYKEPLSATAPLTTNLWITFHGRQRPDGIVIAETVKLAQNMVSNGKDKLRTKHEYDRMRSIRMHIREG